MKNILSFKQLISSFDYFFLSASANVSSRFDRKDPCRDEKPHSNGFLEVLEVISLNADENPTPQEKFANESPAVGAVEVFTSHSALRENASFFPPQASPLKNDRNIIRSS